MSRPVNPYKGDTINWRAGCGKSASPVRREGVPKSIGPPYPYPCERIAQWIKSLANWATILFDMVFSGTCH